MTVFLIASPVLVAVICFTHLAPRFAGNGGAPSRQLLERSVRNPVIVSALAFIPMMLLYLVLSRDGIFSYTPGGLFFKSLLRDYLGWFAVQSAISFVLVRRGSGRSEGDQYLIHLATATVLLTLLALAEVVIGDPVWTAEEIFLRPSARAVLLVLFPIALTVADNAQGGGWAVLLLLLVPPIPALMTMFWEWIRPGESLLMFALLVIVGASAVWYLLFHGNTGKSGAKFRIPVETTDTDGV